MRPHRERISDHAAILVVGLLAIAAGSFAGCDKSPSRPSAAYLKGQVVNAAGAPVAQARIAAFYHLEALVGGGPDACFADDPRRGLWAYPNPAPSNLEARLRVVNDARLVVTIVDRAGAPVRTLLDALVPAGLHALLWDGRADGGSDVPSGIYVIRWRATEGDSVFEGCRRVLLDVVNVDDMDTRAIAVTGADGRFSIPLSSLPTHDGGIGADQLGNITGSFRVSSDIGVCAIAASGSVSACVDSVRLGDSSRDVSVTIHLP